MTNLFQDLKKHTLPAHRALEHSYPFNTMMKNTHFSATTYAHNLHVLYYFHKITADDVSRWLPADLVNMMTPKKVMDSLTQDCKRLGILLEHDFLSQSMNHGRDGSLEDAIAASYVWMGSSMGARIIGGWLARHHPQMPQQYYQEMTNVGLQWQSYVQYVEQWLPTHEANEKQILNSATALFTCLQNAGNALQTAPARAHV